MKKTFKSKVINVLNERWNPLKNIVTIIIGSILFFGTYFLLDYAMLQNLNIDDLVIRCCLAIVHYTGVMFFVLSIDKKHRRIQWLVICLVVLMDLFVNSQLFIYAIVALLLTCIIFLGKKGVSVFFGAVIHSAIALLIAGLLVKYSYFNNESIALYVCLSVSMFIYYLTAKGFVNFIVNNQFRLTSKDNKDTNNLEIIEICNYVYLLYLIGYMAYYINYFLGNIDGQFSDIVNALLITIVAIYQIKWESIGEDIKLSICELINTFKK